jgi:hypothetical protein
MLPAPQTVHVVQASTSTWNPCKGDKDKFGRICKRMLEEKGVDPNKVKTGFKDAYLGKGPYAQDVGCGFEGKLETMCRFLKEHYSDLRLHEWDHEEKIGLPEVHDAAAWGEFDLKWVAADEKIKDGERAQKRQRTGRGNASTPTEDPTIEGAFAKLVSALSARRTTLEREPARHSNELAQLDNATKAVLPMLLGHLDQARRNDEEHSLLANLAASLAPGSYDSLAPPPLASPPIEVRAEPVHSPTAAAAADSAACSTSSAAAPADPAFCSLSASAADAGAAFRSLSADPDPAFCSLSADADPAPAVGCSASADAAPPAAAPASPREALERKLLQLLRSLPGSEAERRVELCYRVAAARAAHA